MKRYTIRRKRRNHTRFLYRAIDAVRVSLDKAKHFFRTLNLRGRVILGSLSLLVIAGLFLVLLPGKKDEGDAANIPPAARQAQDGTIALAEGSEPDAMTLSGFITPSPTPVPTPLPTPTPDPTLKRGMEGEEVTRLQSRLMELDYLDIDEPTDLFGPATEDALKRFQRQHEEEYGLTQDGVAGVVTLELIYSENAKKYALLEGMRGTDVENFQRQLKEMGYLSKVTGYYGDETVAAVKAFQKRNSLHEDGKAGVKTFDMINSDSAKVSESIAKQSRTKANINKMIQTAKDQIGKKYILGNTGPNSYDCSGLVYYCLKAAGSNRRRLNAAGYSNVSDWEKITSYSKLQKGDLLFFYNDAKTKVGHVGIYIGGGEMVDASSRNGKVVRRSATSSYWKSHFVCARRPW